MEIVEAGPGRPLRLTEREEAFRDRIVRRRNLFLLFSVLGVAVGLGVLIHGAIMDSLSLPRLVIVTLVLLLSRSQLRTYRSGVVLWKVSGPPGPREPP